MKPTSPDYYKLIAIAKTYYYLKGEFSTNMIRDFLIDHNFTFHSPMTSKRIGMFFAKCKTIERTKRVRSVSWYKVIE